MRHAGTCFAIAIAAVTCLTAWLYHPGLHGPFVFDDFANLPALGTQGPIDSFPALLRYLTAGHADPTGRPVAMASFLLDARDWPASPLPFKRTNLVLHLVNGALLSLVLLRLAAPLGLSPQIARVGAWFGAAMWMLHPFFVSTVLYVVQREAMLPATFAMLTLLLWLHARSAVAAGGRTPWLSTATIALLTALATLAKANGLLIPLLIICVEAILPPPTTATEQRARRWTMYCFAPVATFIVAWLGWSGISAIGAAPIPIRGWSIGQRLLTEPAILLDYLARLWLLKPPDSSVFHDQYVVATSFFMPWYTLPAIAACVALLVFAWLIRHKEPAVALAILFFFGGHLMESSSLALELYFEHRSYLPSVMMFWPLGLALARMRRPAVGLAIGTLLLAFAATLTGANAALWGDPLQQARVWATIQPDSPRAQAYASQMDASAGALEPATQRIERAAAQFPDEPQIAFTQVNLHCMQGHMPADDARAVDVALRTTRREPGRLMSQWFETMIETWKKGSCQGLSVDELRGWLSAAGENPRIASIAGRRQDLAHLEGLLDIAIDQPVRAAVAFDRALAEEPTPRAALAQAAVLGGAGRPDLGIRHLDSLATYRVLPEHTATDGMPWIHDLVLEHQRYWSIEIEHLRAALDAEARKKNQ